MSSNVDMEALALTTSEDLGEIVRARRRELGLSQQQLAERMGVSRQWLVAMERGHDRAELHLVLRALRVLDLRLEVTPLDDAPELDALLGEAAP